jgi:hypothetical protein
MKNKCIIVLLTVVHFFAPVTASACIGNFTQLETLQAARGNNTSTPVTYVICPNTIYDFTNANPWDMNGNATYLCGTNGSSTNNCVISGGDFQFGISLSPYDSSNKDNILISGFTFTKAGFANAAIAAPGRFTIRDCIFKVRHR